MKYMCFLLIVAVNGSDNSLNEPDSNERIYEGAYSTIQNAPYQAQLIKDYINFYCGATIISPQWLISAGHCFADEKAAVIVYTGSTYIRSGEYHEIETIVRHPKFNSSTLNNDISLIKLKKPIKFNGNQTAIALSKKIPKIGQLLKISGYGREGQSEPHSRVIKIAYVPVVDTETCARNYRSVNASIMSSMFCAGNGQADACSADSGGPAVYDNELVGVISAGRVCPSDFFPGVYTRTHLFRAWILRKISPDLSSN